MEREIFRAALGAMAAGAGLAAALPLRWGRLRTIAAAPGWLLLTAAIAIRWKAAGHAPVFGTFETSMMDAWAGVVIGAAATLWKPRMRWLLPIAVAASAGMMFYAMLFNAKHYPLTISETSLWVDVHASCAWAAYGLYACSAAAAIIMLIAGAKAVEEENLAHRMAEIGFLFQTATIVTGSYYGSILFGRFWQWDPVEVSALLSWVLYGFVIHLKALFGWSGRRQAAWLITAFFVTLLSYKLPVMLRGMSYHFFDLNL